MAYLSQAGNRHSQLDACSCSLALVATVAVGCVASHPPTAAHLKAQPVGWPRAAQPNLYTAAACIFFRCNPGGDRHSVGCCSCTAEPDAITSDDSE